MTDKSEIAQRVVAAVVLAQFVTRPATGIDAGTDKGGLNGWILCPKMLARIKANLDSDLSLETIEEVLLATAKTAGEADEDYEP
jgi:hypothetical protein